MGRALEALNATPIRLGALVVDAGLLLYVVLPFLALAALSAGSVLVLRRRWRIGRGVAGRAARLVEPTIATPPRDPGPSRRPWWRSPWLWIGVSALFAVLGLVVWPGLFGGVFLFVPFVWVWRPRRPTMDPRSNGHSRKEGPV